MAQDIFSTWNVFGKDMFEMTKKLGELNMKLTEKVLKEQIALTEDMMATTAKGVDTLGKVKDPQEFIMKQKTVAEEVSKKLTESYSSYVEIMEDARISYGKMFEEGVDVANKTVKTAKKAA